MNTRLDEAKAENAPKGASGRAGSYSISGAEEVAKRIEKGVRDVKLTVSEKLEDGKIAAERLLKRGRYAVEDGVDEAARNIKRHPFGSLAIAFAAGAAFALLAPRLTRK